jgi:hypothetical protein
VPSKEQLKAAMHNAFDSVVENGPSYTKVYATEVKTKNFVVFRRTTISNFVVGFRPGQTDLVIVSIDENNGSVTAHSVLTVNRDNLASVKKRDLQGRFVIKTTDGQTFRLSVIPSVPKVMAAAYQLPVDQKAEYEAFTAVRDQLTTA